MQVRKILNIMREYPEAQKTTLKIKKFLGADLDKANINLDNVRLSELIIELDLFDENMPDSDVELIDQLRSLINDVVSPNQTESVIELLVDDRKNNNVFQKENLIDMLSLGEKGPKYACGLIVLAKHNLLKSYAPAWRSFACVSDPHAVHQVVHAMHLFNYHQKILTDHLINIFIANSQYAIQLAQGFLALDDAGMLNQDNQAFLLRHASNAQLLGAALVELNANNLLDADNLKIISKNSQYAYSLTSVFCELSKKSMLTFYYKIALVENKIFVDDIYLVFSNLRRSQDDLLVQGNINIVFQKSEHAKCAVDWLMKLSDQSIITQHNFEMLYRYIEILDQDSIKNVLQNLLSPVVTREEYKHWCVAITQERFNHIIELCNTVNSDIKVIAATIVTYLQELIDKQRNETRKYPSNIKSHSTLFDNKKQVKEPEKLVMDAANKYLDELSSMLLHNQ